MAFDELKAVIRKEWDVAFLLIALGLILGWALFISLLSPLLAFAQTEPRAIITWNAIPGAVSGYMVKRGISADILDTSQNAGNVTSFVDLSIEPTIRYWFAVVGYDGAGVEGYPGIASNNPFRFSDIQPASPASVTVQKVASTIPGRVSVLVSWAPVTKTRSLRLIPEGSVVVYNVYSANTGEIQTNAGVPGTSVQIGGLRKHKTVYFYVTAIWNQIESLGSIAVRVQT